MLFDVYHIGYLIFAFFFIAGGITLFHFFVKQKQQKNLVLKIIALTAFLLHISILWVKFLQVGSVNVPVNILFPVYFCNVVMYALLISAFLKNKQGKAFEYLATFAAYGGILGSTITLFYPESYILSRNLFMWDTLKSLLSHTVLLLGSLYLFFGGFVKIKVKNLLPIFAELAFCALDGVVLNSVFAHLGYHSPNSMYLILPAIQNEPITMGWWLALFFVIAVFIFTALWEQFSLKPKQRWYNIFSKYKKEKKFDKIY